MAPVWKAGCTGDLARRLSVTTSPDTPASRVEATALGDATPIPDLPVALLSLCFQKLNGDVASICSAACVCTAWRAAAKAPNVWRIINVGALRLYSGSIWHTRPSPLALRMTGFVLSRLARMAGPALTWLNLSGALLFDAHLNCLRLPACPALRGLSITSCTDMCEQMVVTGRGIAAALQGRKLTYLEVMGIKGGTTAAEGPLLLDALRSRVHQPHQLDIEWLCESCNRLVRTAMIQRCIAELCPNTWCLRCAVERRGREAFIPAFCDDHRLEAEMHGHDGEEIGAVWQALADCQAGLDGAEVDAPGAEPPV